MAGDTKITDATLKAVLNGVEELPLNDSGSDKKTTIAAIKDFISSGLSNIFNWIDLNPQSSAPVLQEGRVWFSGDWHTIEYDTGLGPTIKVGQVVYDVFYNNTGETIEPFRALHLSSAASFGGELYTVFELADSSNYEKIQGTICISCCTVADGELGICASRATKITGGDTSAWTPGSQLWVSDDGSGELTVTKPEFPSVGISVGGNYNQEAAPNGQMIVNITSNFGDIFHEAWDGSVIESFNFTTSSNGTVVTGLLENVNSLLDLTLNFRDGTFRLDTTTSPLTIALTPGTDENTQTNYVYVPIETKVLTISTSGFPLTEHCKIAQCEVQSALTAQSDGGVRRNQNINDHIKKEDNNGHILHIAERLRQFNAEWDNGTEATLTGTTANGYIQMTGGQVWQMHKQTVPSFSMPSQDILIVNDDTTAYRPTDNLDTITEYSDGSNWNNDWSNIVVWGIANKTGEPSFMFCNLPSDGYNSEDNAIADRNNYTDYTIPVKYKGVGFLVARFSIRISGGTITYSSATGYQDLRGFVPNISAGGGSGGGGVTSFLALTDTPSAYTGQGWKRTRVNSAESALEFVDQEYDLSFALSDETSDLTTDNDSKIRVIRDQTIESITFAVNTAPVGSSTLVDVLLNGTTILTVPITLPSGQGTVTITPPQIDFIYLASGDELWADITQIGSTTAGTGAKIYFKTTL